MKCIDRYLLWSFFKTLLITFVSLAGLFVIIDAFANLDEFIPHGQREGSLVNVLAAYYGARILAFFDRTSSILTLIAAMFTVTWLQRHNEITALLAAGISKARIVKPLIAAVAVVSVVAIVNRELVIPQFQERLSRNAQDWFGDKAKPFQTRHDHETNILMNGKYTYADEQRIAKPSFRLPPNLRGQFGRQITAENAYYRAPRDGKPGGYWFRGVEQPENIAQIPTFRIDDRRIILTPADTDWLKPNECFIASNVAFAPLRGGHTWQRFASTTDLIAGLQNPSLEYRANVRVMIHTRMVRPIMDMTLLFLGLPLILTREYRNVFVSIGVCILLVAGFYVLVLICHGLGNQHLLTPAFSAWLPLVISVPLAAALSESLYR